jgi:hypothetical protein
MILLIPLTTGPAFLSKIDLQSGHVPLALFSLAELCGCNTDELIKVLYTYLKIAVFWDVAPCSLVDR